MSLLLDGGSSFQYQTLATVQQVDDVDDEEHRGLVRVVPQRQLRLWSRGSGRVRSRRYKTALDQHRAGVQRRRQQDCVGVIRVRGRRVQVPYLPQPAPVGIGDLLVRD